MNVVLAYCLPCDLGFVSRIEALAVRWGEKHAMTGVLEKKAHVIEVIAVKMPEQLYAIGGIP